MKKGKLIDDIGVKGICCCLQRYFKDRATIYVSEIRCIIQFMSYRSSKILVYRVEFYYIIISPGMRKVLTSLRIKRQWTKLVSLTMLFSERSVIMDPSKQPNFTSA